MAGELGDISFYKSKDGYMARGKSSVSGDRIRNDAAFERTRENAREFGRASRAGKLLRTAWLAAYSFGQVCDEPAGAGDDAYC